MYNMRANVCLNVIHETQVEVVSFWQNVLQQLPFEKSGNIVQLHKMKSIFEASIYKNKHLYILYFPTERELFSCPILRMIHLTLEVHTKIYFRNKYGIENWGRGHPIRHEFIQSLLYGRQCIMYQYNPTAGNSNDVHSCSFSVFLS